MTLSGASWVALFPTSRSTGTLAEPFQTNAERFITALEKAGARVKISATYRPPERAHLMHFAWRIAKGLIAPKDVPAMAGVDIQWDHGDLAASRRAAQAMVDAYGMAYQAALKSRHTERKAIDMTITGYVGLTVVDGAGQPRTMKSAQDLYGLGKSYGVVKLESDPPHWSTDGR